MRILACSVALLMSATLAGVAGAQTTRSTSSPDAALEIRASQAFNRGDYAQALPMLQKLEGELKPDKAQADKVGMVQEQIRVCQKNIPAAGSAVAPAGKPKISIVDLQNPPAAEDRTPHPAPKPGQVLEMTIKELGNFEYDADKNTPLPDDVKALNGATVKLRGFMIPMDQAENISKFALVPSLFACCYGQPPQVQHTIVVNCPKGKAVQYYADEITVEGKLTVEVVKEDGFVLNIFTVETTSVKPVAK